MAAQLEGIETFHEFNGASFVAAAELDLNAANIEQYAGQLVLAIHYKGGLPTIISGPVCGQNTRDTPADESKGTFYVPTTLGRIGTKHSDTHFTVVPLGSDEGTRAQPPRLFAFGEALVKTASKQDIEV